MICIKHFATVLLLVFINQTTGQSLYLNVKSNNPTKDSIIQSTGYKKTFKNYKLLDLELNTLNQKLTRLGYIDVNIHSITKANDSVFQVELILGQKIDRIRIKYNKQFNTQLINNIALSRDSMYFDVDISQIETILDDLNRKIATQGDPFSQLRLVNITKQNAHLLTADLSIVRNKQRHIDKIIIQGYDKFPKSYLKRFLKLKPEDLFNLKAINTKATLIDDLRFAKMIKDPEVLFTNDSTTLYLYIEKIRSNKFDGILGFGNNETTNKLEFDGYLDLQLVNNLNFGERLNIYYKSDEIDQQTLKIDTELPYLFKSPIGLKLGLNLFRKDTTFSNATQYAKLNYKINAKHDVSIGITGIKSTNLLETNTAVINDYTSQYYNVNYNYVKTQLYDTLFPVNFWFSISLGLGYRNDDVAQRKQRIYELDTYKIFNLNLNNSIYVKLKGALLNSDNYLDNELFRFGGITSIRGFEENSLVANLYSVLNTEYRYRLSNTLYVNSILDAGFFENKITLTEEKLFGFGFGFGLLTNAGLFRLNYAAGKTEKQQFKLSNSKVHLSLTATF